MAKKILLIEDDPFLTEIYTTKFEEVGYDIEVANNGEDGSNLAKETSPDVILLDIILPKINGLEVLTMLKKEEKLKNTPIIILSNLGAAEDVNRAIDLGANDYLIKSQYTPSEVVAKIEEVLKNN
ncbi:MAG: response regulator [Candidatus Spechtbacterales bacterium]